MARCRVLPSASQGLSRGRACECEPMTLIVVIPTYADRTPFLARALRYYGALEFRHKILIADSSPGPAAEANQDTVNALGNRLHVEYQRFAPDIHVIDKIVQAVSTIDSAYTVLGADDDFAVPAALEQAIGFLEGHPDYALAHGEAALFAQHAVGGRQEIGWVCRYVQRSIEHPTGAQRLLDHLGHYSTTWYSMQRTEHLRQTYQKTRAVGKGLYFLELLPSCLSVIRGKAKKLDRLYMVREGHAGMNSRKELDHGDVFDWITDPEWPSGYHGFRDCLSEELVRQDGITGEEARAVVKQALWVYLGQVLLRKSPVWQGRQTHSSRMRLREIGRRIPGLPRAWRVARSIMPGRDAALSLEALLRSTSRYHQDFMPVVDAIEAANGHDGVGGS